jgi:hypothetical protein
VTCDFAMLAVPIQLGRRRHKMPRGPSVTAAPANAVRFFVNVENLYRIRA